MLSVLEGLNKQSKSKLYSEAGPGQFVKTPAYRPVTKYERRAQRLGHGVWDLMFKKA